MVVHFSRKRELTLCGVVADSTTSDTNNERTPRRDEPARGSSSYESSDSAGAETHNGIFTFSGVIERAPYDAALVVT